MKKFFKSVAGYLINPKNWYTPKTVGKTPTGYVVKKTDERMAVGHIVYVYDRYRFAIPLKGEIVKFADSNDGVEVRLHESNNYQYPIGKRVWVHSQQLRRTKS